MRDAGRWGLVVCALLALWAGAAEAVFPFIIEDTEVAYGHCFEDADCDIVLATPNASVTCDAQIGRCVDGFGVPLAPVLNQACPGIGLATRVWDSILFGTNGMQDGLIRVDFSAAPSGRAARGSLRVYQLAAGSPATVVNDLGYLREQVVNFPCMTYLFRNLPPVPNLLTVYRVAYFDFLGCTLQADVMVEHGGAYAVPIAQAEVPALGFVDFSTVVAATPYATLAVDASAGSGKRVRFGVPEPVWAGINEDALTGARRVVVGQLFDQGGAVLQTVVGQDLYLEAGDPLTGLLFPPFRDNTTFSTFEGPSALAGRVFFRAVVGFSYVPAGSLDPAADRVLLRDAWGVVEGLELRRVGDETLVRLSDVAGLPPHPPPYAGTAAYYEVDGLHVTTTYQSTDNPGAFAGVDFATLPNVTFTHINTFQRASLPQMCLNGTTPGILVSLDYSAFLFTQNFMIATARLVAINTSTADMTELAVGFPVPVLEFVEFAITAPGFYCVLLDIDLLDGNIFTPPIVGPRRFARTCFQVPGPMRADAVHVASRIGSLDNAADQNGGSIVAGVYTNVDSDFIVTLPAVLVRNREHVVRITLLRNLADVFQQDITEFLEANEFDVFEDAQLGSFDIEFFYTAEPVIAGSQYRVHYLRRSIFHGPDGTFFRLMKPAATLFPDETARVGFDLYFNETLGVPKAVRQLDYECDTLVKLKNLVAPNLQTRIEVTRPLCPNERGLMVARTTGLFAFALDNPVYATDFSSPAPYQNPLANYHRWLNDEPGHPAFGTVLDADLNRATFSAPPNIRIRLQTIANNGGVGVATATAVSIVSEDATTISFLPQEPVCINGTQFVRLSYVLNGVVDGAIAYWQPLDVYAIELYNPNLAFFRIPTDCVLLSLNFTAYEVFQMCQSPVMVNTSVCAGCNNLPIARPEVDGATLVTGQDDQFWELVVWVPTDDFNNATGRFRYCRSARSIRARVPRPTSLLFQNLRRVLIDPPLTPAVPCQGDACFAVTITADVDDFYQATLGPLVTFAPSPPFQVVPDAVTAGDPLVEIGTPYEFLVFLDDVLCPAIVPFTPLPRGPQGLVAQTTRSSCGDATGSALIFARYSDPDELVFGRVRDVCMFWPNRDVLAPQVSGLATFFSFTLPVNAPVATSLPFDPDFGLGTERFENVRGGLHRVLFYDRCVSGSCGNVDCATLVADQSTFQLTNPNLAFHVFEFNVTDFQNPAGGILVQQTRFIEAQCFGDTYEISYTVFDDRGPSDGGNPPYEVYFFEPVSGALLEASPVCVGDPPVGGVPANTFVNEIDGFRIKLFTFNVTIETGPQFGFRQSGNYTLQVRSCATGCIATFTTFIEIVQPIDIVLTALPSTCAYTPGALVAAIAGGKPGPSGQFFALPGSNVTREKLYTEFWLTPLTGGQYVETVLGIRNIPGNYSLCVEDANVCRACKNVTIGSPPPISVSLEGIDAVCEDSIVGTFRIRGTGGTGELNTIQPLATVRDGQDITFEFVATINRTLEFTIADEVGCILPSPLSFAIPDPGPLPLTLTTTDTCGSLAEGTATAVVPGGNGVTCKWIANGVAVPVIETCFLEGLPGGTFVGVTATDIFGCSASATAVVPTRPQITVTEVERTVDGDFGEACTDTITFAIAGGLFGPPFIVTLFNDFSNATLVYNGTSSGLITGVCRAVQYTLFVRDSDNECPVVFFSVDPEFGFGVGQDDSPLGLPLADLPIFGSAFDIKRKPNANVHIEVAAVAVSIFIVAVVVILVLVLVPWKKRRIAEKEQ